MAQGMLHRAGEAIVLIAVLLLPYGRCQSPVRGDGHDCCVHPPAPAASLESSCCTVRSQLPAIVGQRAVLSAPPVATMAFAGTATESAIQLVIAPKSPMAQHSPPPGASVLRI
jgi:hypothetical protein